MSRSVSVDGGVVTIDGTPVVVMTREEYLANPNRGEHLMILVDNFVRVKRSNGSAMLQIPAAKSLTVDEASKYLARWFLENEGSLSDQLEDAARAVAAFA